MGVSILVGDVRARLREMQADSVDCVVTSPPYWGLRDYGVEGQIGLEPTLGEHLSVMVEVFEEVRRVLKPTGTLWLNYGDCYAGSWGAQSRGGPPSDKSTLKGNGHEGGGPKLKSLSAVQIAAAPKAAGTGSINRTPGLKPKDLCMVPNRLAIALQEAGWWVRSEIIWAKPNPMPESINDRPAGAHEKIFLLSRAPRYFYDADAVRQGRTSDEDANTFRGGAYTGGDTDNATTGKRKVRGNQRVPAGRRDSFRREDSKRAAAHPGQNMGTHRPDRDDIAYPRGEGRNLRNYEPAPVQVWPIATRPFSEAHFATFPPELAERCLQAGCPAGGTVLDPFGGAGTTALVADRMGLDCTIIELNPEYAEIARNRIASEQGMFANVQVAA